MPRKAVLLHRKQQEINEIFFRLELEVVEKAQLAVFQDDHVEIVIPDIDEHPLVYPFLHQAFDEYAARMGDFGLFPLGQHLVMQDLWESEGIAALRRNQ